MTNFDIYLEKQLDNPDFKKEYDELEIEFEVIKQIIDCRTKQNLTQKDLAERIGVKQSNISRLESGNYNPSLDFLKRIADGLGKKVHIEFR